MLKEKENIDRLFADFLCDYEEEAPAYLWANIQSDLKKTRRLKRYSNIRAIAAVIALLLTFGLGYYSSDFSQRNKYEARYLIPNSDGVVEHEKSPLIEDSSRYLNEFSENSESSEKKSKTLASEVQNTAKNKKENNSILYKLFDLTKDFFSEDSKNEINTNQFAQDIPNRKEITANQLLIDTLLEKENLQEGGFLLSQKDEHSSRWSFGTKFSPVYSVADNSGQSANIEQSSSLKSVRIDDRPDTKSEEKALMAFSGGINVNYQFAKRWSLESGLFYSQRKQVAENLIGSSMNGYNNELQVYTPQGVKFLQPEFSDLETSTPDIIGSSRDETYYALGMNYISNFEYIELPIIVRYKIVDKKLGLDLLSGVTTNFLIGNRSSIVQDETDLWTGQTEDINPMLYNATLGVGLNYNFYRNFSFNLEPTFKYAIISSESSIISRYPYSFAVFAGFTYRFK
ncbi:MAG: outer membrane beta-barrel protein [Bacteroidales bacterium]|nr:outer membrane beta-barrel protein [Bacteroidales bacterium]